MQRSIAGHLLWPGRWRRCRWLCRDCSSAGDWAYLLLSGGNDGSIVVFVLHLGFLCNAFRFSDVGEAAGLFRNPSFLLLGLALFMYVARGFSSQWVVTFMQRDD